MTSEKIISQKKREKHDNWATKNKFNLKLGIKKVQID